MINRLRRTPRIDRLESDVRARPMRLGRWVYIGLLAGFFYWILDITVGPMLRLQADGLVVSDYVAIALPFAAQIDDMPIAPGASVRRGDMLARVTSVELTKDIATLTARNADLIAQKVNIERRAEVAKNLLPIAEERATEAEAATKFLREFRKTADISTLFWTQALQERYVSRERVAELRAELQTTESGLKAVNAAIADAASALGQLQVAYRAGTIHAPEDGIIGLRTARPGDVVNPGQTVMVLYRPRPYVLTYLETGTLYNVKPGDTVSVSDGFVHRDGRVTEVLPVADQLPEEFRKAFQPRGRSQVARIELFDSGPFPLFAKVGVSGDGWAFGETIAGRWVERFFAGAARGAGSKSGAADG